MQRCAGSSRGREPERYSSQEKNTMPTLVLLGDSILDNGPYVGAGEAVIDALAPLLSQPWRPALLARDGSTTTDVRQQLRCLPADASRLVVSCGGNDALGHLGALQAQCATVHAALSMLVPLVDAFRRDYRGMLADAMGRGCSVTVCTVYDAVPGLDGPTRLALALFNDVILREAICHRVNVIDMRTVATQPEDFAAASPIEPSAIGARKIAAVIADALSSRMGTKESRVFGGLWHGL
jgi:hypothetical protein